MQTFRLLVFLSGEQILLLPSSWPQCALRGGRAQLPVEELFSRAQTAVFKPASVGILSLI